MAQTDDVRTTECEQCKPVMLASYGHFSELIQDKDSFSLTFYEWVWDIQKYAHTCATCCTLSHMLASSGQALVSHVYTCSYEDTQLTEAVPSNLLPCLLALC